jgi:hypothetical protein
MAYAPTFHPTFTTSTSMTQYDGVIDDIGPRIVFLSSGSDFYVNYGSSATANRFWVEANSAQPMRLAVDDIRELYFQSSSGTPTVFVISYPINTVVP